MAMTQHEWYLKKAQEDKARLDAAHEVATAHRRNYMASDPGGFNPWEKKQVEDYFRQKEASRQFDEGQRTARGQWGFTDPDGTHHAGGAEAVAQYDWMGKRDAGSTAAQINADAARYGADKKFEGIEKQAQNALEIEKERQKYLDIINERDNKTKIRQSEIEWGNHDGQGNYTPGGRVKQAEAQGEAAARVAEQNNQAKIEAERIKAEGKQRAERLRGNAQIIAAIRNNPVYAAKPELAQQALESLPQDMSDEEAVDYMEFKAEKAKKAIGAMTAEGYNKKLEEERKKNAKSEAINNEVEKRKQKITKLEGWRLRAGESLDTGIRRLGM